MDLTLTLPDHVAAAWPDADTAAAWLLAAATDHARSQEAAAAADDAQQLIRDRLAPFDTAELPAVPTVAQRIEAAAERIEEVASRTVLLAGTLATLPSVGGDPIEVQAAISEVVDGFA